MSDPHDVDAPRDGDVRQDAVTLVRLLTGAGRTVAVAESLTGGALTDAFVTVPGASRSLRGGVVAYATDLKASLLGVDPALLRAQGAVHPDVARQMATGVRRLLGADYGVATTGVAGPDDQDGHPPGTFHVAVEGPSGDAVASAGPAPAARSRHDVRAAACDAALALLLREVSRDLDARADADPDEPGPVVGTDGASAAGTDTAPAAGTGTAPAAGTGTAPAAGTEQGARALDQP